MKITNEPLVEGLPVKFIITGFPEEDAVKASVERFYSHAPHASRSFFMHNAFDEEIFSGQVDDQGKILTFTPSPRPTKSWSVSCTKIKFLPHQPVF